MIRRALPFILWGMIYVYSVELQSAAPQPFQIMPGHLYGINQGSSANITARPGALKRLLKSKSTTAIVSGTTSSQIMQGFAALRNQKQHRNAKSKPLISTRQQEALSALTQESINGEGVRVYFDAGKGTPSFIKLDMSPPSTLARAANLDIGLASARHFLNKNRDLLKLRDPATELSFTRRIKGQQGDKHLKFEQTVNGIPLWGSELSLHLKPDNSVYLLSGRYHPSITDLSTIPSITQADAQAKVLEDLNRTWVEKIDGQLAVFKKPSGEAVLTYQIQVSPSMAERWIYFVDATTGNIVHKINNLQNVVVTGQGIDGLGNTQTFNAWSENSQFYMIDPTTPLNDPVHDPLNETKPRGDTYILDARNGVGESLSYSTSNSQNSDWDSVAVSAMVNARTVYDYYLDTHGRKSLDNNHQNLMTAIHFDINYANAFWNGSFMVYGDGDGQVFGPLASCLDVAAHEMTHGVIENSANLIYENQSGALNESFADIFAALVDRDDWLIGEDCVIPSPGYLRSLQDPSLGLGSQPSKMSEYQNLPNTPDTDNGGVHINSGIPNRAAYLIAEGLSAEGTGVSIGKGSMGEIFYRALTTYLTASAQFIDARRATIQAAEDIFGVGSKEATAVAVGWDLVEVVEDGQTLPDKSEPTPTEAVAGSDFMIYLFPVDGTRDFDPSDTYALYQQQMTNPLVYDQNLDIALLNSISASPDTRPAAFTDSTGSYIYYVGSDNNIYMIDRQSAQESQLTFTSDIWSMAISYDGQYAAYTSTDSNDDNIHVIDFNNNTAAAYPISTPNYSDGSTTLLNTAQYADALSFDYTGRKVVFDFLNCLTTEQSSCASGGGYQYWSIGMMDVITGEMFFPFPNQNPDFDLSYPVFAENNNFVIAFDFSDYSDSGSGNILSQVQTVNISAQEASLVHDYGVNSSAIYGLPGFWGDDDFITIEIPGDGLITTAGTLAYRVALGTNGDSVWEGGNGLLEEISPYAVAFPIMHRQGIRSLTGSLDADTNNIDFGDVDAGTRVSRSLQLSNNGNSDINITGISLSGERFSHNGTNTLLPKLSSISINIYFDPGSTPGTSTGLLSFSTESNPAALSVSLVGNTIGGSGTTTVSTSGGGSTGFMFLLVLIFIKETRIRSTCE